MKLLLPTVLALILTGCTASEPVDPAVDAACKSFATKDLCVADSRCEWFLRTDGQNVCRAKR